MGRGRAVDEALEPSNRPRPLDPLMRAALYLGSLLVFLAGVQLFVFTRETERLFAWTIAAANSAAFLGAFYWTSVPLAFLSARERTWERARVGVPGVLVFLVLTLATTVIHFDKFHFQSSAPIAKGAAWVWLLIYAVDPLLIAVALVRQLRMPGRDGPRTRPLGSLFRATLGLNSGLVLAVAVALFAAPLWAARWWPWELTPLTARAMASWLLGLGVVQLTSVMDNDWARIRSATIAYTVLGALELVALARFSGEVDWANPVAWLFVAFFAGVLTIGSYGWYQANRWSAGAPA
jgi:hypothetical protein